MHNAGFRTYIADSNNDIGEPQTMIRWKKYITQIAIANISFAKYRA